MRYLIATTVASAMLAGTAFAATINVPGDHSSIQGAIDASSNGDTILVASGTYTGSGDAVITMPSHDITLKATGSVTKTIIDGEGVRRVIRCHYGSTSDTVIEGFTVTNGQNSEGAGILCVNSSPTITGCRITANTSPWGGGGGIRLANSSATVTDCEISNNTDLSGGGGGLYCSGGGTAPFAMPTITGCTIENNQCHEQGRGGGVNLSGNYLFVTMDNCEIMNNQVAAHGGGMHLTSGLGGLTISSSRISGNSANQGGGINCDGGSLSIVNCTISGNFVAGNAFDAGGGMYISNESTPPPITDTLICGNHPDQINGNWDNSGGGNDVLEACPYVGACCTGNETLCVADMAEADCVQFGGQWLGVGSSCDDCPPPPEPESLGACCIQGSCVPTTLEGCFDADGSYAGDGVSCEDADCPSSCEGDTDSNGAVDIFDLLKVIGGWGDCP